MATVTRESIGLLNDKLIVKVEKDDYLPSFQKAIKEYSKKANIPGFRKGMVPVGMVKKMYGSSVFADEVIKSVEKGLSDFMSTEKLQIFAQPLPLPDNDSSKLDMNQPSEYQFAFEVGLKPEFTLVDLSPGSFTRYKVDVTDDILNKEIDSLQKGLAKKVDQETVTAEENELTLYFMNTDAEGNEKAEYSRKEISILVKDFNPEIQAELIGKKNEDLFSINAATAFSDDTRERITGELGLTDTDLHDGNNTFKVVIAKITNNEKPLLNEDLFKQVFPDKEIDSEETFRQEVKRDIEKQWESSSTNQLHDQIFHALLHTEIEFPEDFLKRWMLTGTDKQKSPEEVETEFPKFVKQLKWTLIMEKIVSDNNIEVGPNDLREFAKMQLLSYMGGSNINIDQPWVSDYVERMMKDKKFVEDSFQRIQVEKILSWAETQVNPVEVTISEDEFAKMLKEHKHED